MKNKFTLVISKGSSLIKLIPTLISPKISLMIPELYHFYLAHCAE